MEGILARDGNGNPTSTAFKVKGVPMAMKDTGLDDIMAYVMAKNTLNLTTQSPAYRRLRHGIGQAVTELGNLHQQHCQFVPEPKATDTMFSDLVATSHVEADKLFSEVADAYCTHIKAGMEAGTLKRKQIAYAWFKEKFGDLPFQSINKRTHGNGFQALLTKLPKNAEQRHKGKALADLEGMEGEKLSHRSQEIYLAAMRSLFTWAIDNAGYYQGENPFRKVTPPAKAKKGDDETGNPFSQDTLKTWFASSLYTGHLIQRTKRGNTLIKDGCYWIPLVALLTGARMQEICQLYTKDVYEKDGVWVVDINDNGPDKHLKNRQSKRIVPVHHRLVALGFIDYCTAQKGQRLFPDVSMGNSKKRYSATYTKVFANQVKTLKLKRNKENFHSFRHTMIDAMREAKLEEGIIQALVGHKDDRQVAKYGKGYSMAVLKQAIDKVDYPFIAWAKVGIIAGAKAKP